MGRQTVPSSTAPLATHLDNKQDDVLQNNDNQPVKHWLPTYASLLEKLPHLMYMQFEYQIVSDCWQLLKLSRLSLSSLKTTLC
jgi:hypothetical protein